MSQVTAEPEVIMMVELTLIISISLLLMTLGVIAVYFGKMKKVSREYLEAKNILGDIVLSFKSDLQRQEDRVESIAQLVDGLRSSDDSSKQIEELRAQVADIRKDLEEGARASSDLCGQFEELTTRVEDLFVQEKQNFRKISELQQTRRQQPLELERIEAAIPIKRERALARLTDTELRVLEILADEGERTASEVRDKVKLTREHTSRLMKSLYTRGYVDRTAARLPYEYRIKDEMRQILKKQLTT